MYDPLAHACVCEGLLPRIIDDVFEEVGRGEGGCVSVSFVELYNNGFYDLCEGGVGGGGGRIEIHESTGVGGRGVHLTGVTRVACTDAGMVHELVRRGNGVRSTSGTALNERSSRSHAVVTIEVEVVVGGEVR